MAVFSSLAANDTGHHHHHPVLTDEQWFLYISIAVGLVLLAGLMSGLTLGLMSMDVLDMEVTALTKLPRPQLCFTVPTL